MSQTVKNKISLISKTIAITLLFVLVMQDTLISENATGMRTVELILAFIALVTLFAGVFFEEQKWKLHQNKQEV